MRKPVVPILADPKLIDKALLEVQTKLTTKLIWLDGAYGKVQRLTKVEEKRKINFPGIYTGSKQGKGYESAMPSDHLGNFSFFTIKDGEKLGTLSRRNTTINAEFGLIFWFRYDKIYPDDWKQRTIENVKDEVVSFFRTTAFRNCRMTIEQFFELPENIYKGFTDREVENDYLMRPFGGLRVNGKIHVNQLQNC